MSIFAFPDDLIRLQENLEEVRHARSALLATLPTFAEASKRPEAAGWAPGDPPLGRTGEEAEQELRLRQKEVDLAAEIHGHAFWATCTGPALVDARSALKHARSTGPAA